MTMRRYLSLGTCAFLGGWAVLSLGALQAAPQSDHAVAAADCSACHQAASPAEIQTPSGHGMVMARLGGGSLDCASCHAAQTPAAPGTALEHHGTLGPAVSTLVSAGAGEIDTWLSATTAEH